MNVVSHNCPACGAILNFNPNTQNWICNYCKVNYTLDMLSGNVNEYNKSSIDELNEIECNNCGAKLITDSSTSSTVCTYCNSSVIIKKRLDGEYKPDYIIPFRNTEEKIKNLFIKHIKSKSLCPNKFKNKKNIKSITSLYVPFWLVSTNVFASIQGNLFTDKYYNYKEFKRVGTMRLEKVPFDGKSNLDNDMLKGILPFDYSDLKKFEYPYLAGFYAEVFDENQNKVYEEQIKESIREASINKLVSTVPGYKNGKKGTIENAMFNADDFKYEYVLVPVWFIKMEYEGKIYEYCVNDSNYYISGKYPLNKFKCFLMYFFDYIIFCAVFKCISIINEKYAFYIAFALFALLLKLIDSKIKSYTKYKTRKSTTEYINDNSFKILYK